MANAITVPILQTKYTICVTPGCRVVSPSYAAYNQIATVSQCTTLKVPWCIVNNKCQELVIPNRNNGLSFDGTTAQLSVTNFDGLIAEIPPAATCALLNDVSVGIGDLSRYTNLTSLYEPPFLTMRGVGGLTSLPPLDYSHLTSFSARNNQLTSIVNINVSRAKSFSLKDNVQLASIQNLVLSPKVVSIDCTGCSLTTVVVDPTTYKTLEALPPGAFTIQSLDVVKLPTQSNPCNTGTRYV
ncbi:Aste57867_11782 [Aphanomyces stellatus]|uniref:Aste57867_11782 protein n=1 Tax=Aphanomyces stellatus TaxID=120398 RepID=A0A485KVU7_9STRA|nr:hypothetical protein As57867_011737 [Aphanomyces stellatus]VFT88638.1 Aste57867_11782 [Aphanomyces stellatus]